MALRCVRNVSIWILFCTLLNIFSFTNHTIFCSDKDATNQGVHQPKDASLKKEKNDVVLKSCLSSPDNPATKKRREGFKMEGKEKRVHFELGDNVVHMVPKWDCGKRISRKKKKPSSKVLNLHPCGHAHTKSTKQTSSSGSWYYTLQEKVLACIVFVILCVVIVFYSLLKSKNRYKISRNKKLFKEKKG